MCVIRPSSDNTRPHSKHITNIPPLPPITPRPHDQVRSHKCLSIWWLAAFIRLCLWRECYEWDHLAQRISAFPTHTEDNICLKFTRFKCRTWCSLHVLLLRVIVTSDHKTQVPWHFSFLRDDANKKIRMKRWSSSFSVFIVGLMRSHLFLKIQFHWKSIELQLKEKEAVLVFRLNSLVRIKGVSRYWVLGTRLFFQI